MVSSLRESTSSTANKSPSNSYVPEVVRRRRTEADMVMVQEPRKSDAPQLRDEYRTYKILVGCRESLTPKRYPRRVV